MFETLDQLIECLLVFYTKINQNWECSESYKAVNLRKNYVEDILRNDMIWNTILEYRRFISIEQLDILQEISSFQSDTNHITLRIKQQNSIEYKINRYNNGQLKGKVAINKCLNDLFGIRIIIDSFYTFEDLSDHIKSKYPNMKLTDASKNGYIASHLYFMESNTLFPWELQIWKKVDEKNNLESHKIYKQDYTSWERDFKNN